MKELQGKVMSVGEHHRDDEESHGVYVEVSKEQLRDRGVGFLYREVRVEIVDPRPAISAAEAEQTLRAKTQPPSACPFCGAARKPACAFAWFLCGTMTAPSGNNRRDQTPSCATAERERLTRERDEAMAAYTNALNQIGDLCIENAGLKARVKRLEEAGDAMAADDQCHPHLMEDWEKAKEATP
jgi:hypothetical protein